MSSFPNNEDRQLTQFLRQNRPPVPSAAPDLEDRLMALIAENQSSIAVDPVTKAHRRGRRSRAVWLLPSAIAASVMAIVSYHILFPPRPTDAQLAELQTFIESTWNGTVAEQPATETEQVYPPIDEAGVN